MAGHRSLSGCPEVSAANRNRVSRLVASGRLGGYSQNSMSVWPLVNFGFRSGGGNMESQLPSLVLMEERLRWLERQNRVFKLLVTVVVIFAAVLLVLGQAAPARKTVEANEFILKDGNGNTRARLRMGGNFWAVPQLDLLDEKGTLRVQLFGGRDRIGGPVNVAGISVFDEHGRQRGMFSSDNDGAALPFINVKGSDDALVRGKG